MLRIIRCIGRACRLRALAAVLTVVPLLVASTAAHAAYPDRVITLIVPFAAGGPTDIIARIVSLAFQKSLGQSVVVENRGGAAGNIGMTIAARAAPDGYTLLLSSTAIAVNPALFKNLRLRSDQGLRAGVRAGQRAQRDRRAGQFRHRHARRSHRAREGRTGHVQLREPRRGHQVASHRRAAQAARRHRHGARAVSRRRSGGDGGAGGNGAGRLGGAWPPRRR